MPLYIFRNRLEGDDLHKDDKIQVLEEQCYYINQVRLDLVQHQSSILQYCFIHFW